MAGESHPWYAILNPETQISPSLLVYPDRIRHNIQEMVKTAGDPSRLRPHIKTHKTTEIIKMQQAAGIDKFKCATIAEAELLGSCEANDVLLAYQPVGPDQDRFFGLCQKFPNTRFSTLVDNLQIARKMASMAKKNECIIELYIDMNVGMNRTGISAGSEAETLLIFISNHTNLNFGGLHVYDGHIRDMDFKERKKKSDLAFGSVLDFIGKMEELGYDIPTVVAGGSPTFPVHALRDKVELSPGTTLLWDFRYNSLFPDMNYEIAAVLLTRVVSHPAPGFYCLDLGHKAIAPEMDFPRVHLMGMEKCEQTGQSEEHLVVKCPENKAFEIGQEIYGIPMHICPTVAKYPELLVVENNEVTGSWKVAARDYKIQI